MGNIRFELLMPSSWLHKLKQHKSRGRRSSSSQLPQNSINKPKLAAPPTAAAAARTTPSARSKQIAEHLPCSPVNTKASDTHFPADLRPNQRRQRRLHPRRRAAGNPCIAIASSVSCNFARTLTSKKPTGQVSHRAAAAASCGDLDFLPEEKEHETKLANSPEEASPAASATPGSDDEGDLVVIKYASANPDEDFTGSMVEMIVEHGICDARGLEDLLACYLSLNSEEHHEVIIEVFERIWFALADAELL